MRRGLSLHSSVVTFIAGAILLAAVAWSVVKVHRREIRSSHGALLSGLPSIFSGWQILNLPVATSPEMEKTVVNTLNYDDAIYREYHRGQRSFTLYAAYWKSYKIHPRLVAIHTPDVCWVANGWSMVAVRKPYLIRVNGRLLWRAQYREFSRNGATQYVLYWHLVSGHPSDYASGPDSAPVSFWRSWVADIADGAGEQFFIRLASSEPWDSLAEEPVVQEILDTFGPVLSADYPRK
jgi:hypothetical protein